MSNLTKREIINEIYAATGYPQKEIIAVVQMSLDHIVNALAAGRNVELRNIGIFQIKKRLARVGRNPKKPGSEMIISPRAAVKFKSGKILKNLLKRLAFPPA